jgi:crotonobetainyl-CoA:carnitine CoA-transferase CaiB-like acyl-CoA transferase
MPSALDDIVVLDLTRALAGPFCTQILGDLGAEVLKVEPLPGGDPNRGYGPPFQNGVGLYFWMGNRNKRSLALNFRAPEARAVLRRLAVRSDVLVENFRPGVIDEIGLGYEGLRAENPGLVCCSLSGFGQRGPYRDRPGFDQIAQGMSGLMSVTGAPGGGPLRFGVPIGDLVSGLYGAIGILAALRERERSGQGQRVEGSLLEGLISLLSIQAAKYFAGGEAPQAEGNDHPLIAPYGAFPTEDGAINIAIGNEEMWGRLCRALAMPELAADPRFARNAQRMAHRAELRAILEAALRQRGQAEWVKLLNDAGVACGPIYDLEQVFGDPHVQHLRMIQAFDHPTLGHVQTLRFPVTLGRSGREADAPPPALGEHTDAILARAGYDAAAIADLRARGVVGPGRPA